MESRLSLFRTIADFVDGRLRFCGVICEAAPKSAPCYRGTPATGLVGKSLHVDESDYRQACAGVGGFSAPLLRKTRVLHQCSSFSPLFSPGGEAKCVRGPSVQGARRSARGSVLEQYVEHGEQAQRSKWRAYRVLRPSGGEKCGLAGQPHHQLLHDDAVAGPLASKVPIGLE